MMIREGNDILGSETFWKQIGLDIIGEVNGDQFGWSVSISKDSKTIAAGTKTNDGNTGKGVRWVTSEFTVWRTMV